MSSKGTDIRDPLVKFKRFFKHIFSLTSESKVIKIVTVFTSYVPNSMKNIARGLF